MTWKEILKRADTILSIGEENTRNTYMAALRLFDDVPTRESVMDAVVQWKGEVSNSTIILRFAALRWVFSHFKREFDPDEVEDMISFCKNIKRTERKMNFATLQNVKKVLDYAESKRDYRTALAISMMAYGGMRISEVMAVSLSDWRNNPETGNPSILIKESKNNTQRYIEVLTPMRRYFDLYVNGQRESIIRRKGFNTDKVFLTSSGEMPIDTMRRNVKEVCKKCKLPDLHCHSFRHGFGTALAEMGIEGFVIQKAMGHKSMATTAKYVHLSDRKVSEDIRRTFNDI